MVTQLDITRAVARVIVAGVVRCVGVCAAVGSGSRQDIVLVRHVPDTINGCALLIQCGYLVDAVTEPCLLDRVAVQLGSVRGDDLSTGIRPRSSTDPVARVDSAGSLSAEVCTPGCHAAARGG